MLSWTAWKERWNWLRDRWAAIAASLPVGVLTGAAAAAVLLVLYLGVQAYRTWPAPWDWLQGGTNGQVIVNSPTLYTRQRLVNDRLSQTAWLQEQLKAADKNFRSVDQLYRSIEERQRALGLAPAAQPAPSGTSQTPTTNSETKKVDQVTNNPLVVDATTPAEFRAKNLYRDEVRAEITQTQLDDRHDISGNTIYRLAFDATVIAGSRRNAVAGIKITISHRPFSNDDPALELLYRDDYVKLYLDWLRYMQQQVNASVNNLWKGLISERYDAKAGQLMTQFLLDRICHLKLELETPTSSNTECDPERLDRVDPRYEDAAKHRRETVEFFNAQLKQHFAKREKKSIQDFKAFLLAYATKDEQEALSYYEPVQLYCRRENLIQIDLKLYIKDLKTENPTIDCPFYDSPATRLKLGVLIYEELIRLKEEIRESGQTVNDLPNELERRRICEGRKDLAFCWYTEQYIAARCFSSDFVKWSLNRPSRNRTKSDPVPPSRTIDYFLILEPVGRESGECGLLVSETTNQEATIKELKYILNEDTEAFAYSVTPKNFTENISTASETRDTFELLARYAVSGEKNVNAVASQLLQRASEMRAVLANPIVVGFGSGTKTPEIIKHPTDGGRSTSAVREIEVGWIVAPRKRDGALEQIDNQYALTMVISVPSWWRSVELVIKTCWLSRARLPAIRLEKDGAVKMCDDASQPLKNAVVRLPGAIAELSRKLGFDVLEEPYLTDNPTQVLEIGQPGNLLLKGSRLWRSTEVTLGSQKAQQIVVLPNMDGIIASFPCVLPQFRDGGYDHQPIKVNAYVWTSEGVTTGAPVLLIWPGQNASSNNNASARHTALSHDDSSARNSPASGDGSLARSASLKTNEAKWCPDLWPKSTNP